MRRGVLIGLAWTLLPGIGQSATGGESSTTYVYRCDGLEQTIVVRLEGDKGHLFAPGASQSLRFDTASQSFVGEDVSYFPDRPPDLAPGQTATITLADKTLKNCHNNPRAAVWENAKLNGVSYRAIGQEPGWVLEIDRSRGFKLVTGYGEQQAHLPYTEPETDAASRTTVYRSVTEAGELVVRISGEQCTDSMSGEQFESRAEVEWQGKLLKGCGRALH